VIKDRFELPKKDEYRLEFTRRDLKSGKFNTQTNLLKKGRIRRDVTCPNPTDVKSILKDKVRKKEWQIDFSILVI